MIIPKKVQKWPPLWLCLGLPIFLLLSAASVYHQEALSEAISKNAPSGLTGDIVSKIYGTFGQSDATKHHEDEPEKPVEPTIIREGNHDEYLAVCLFAKNQAADMVEFFQHHYHELGIRRFYVMDDGSEPPLSTFADEYGIPPEAIDFIYYPHITDVPQGAQLELDNHCAFKYGVNNTWLAFIDVDEFFDLPGGETLEEILKSLEKEPNVGALGVNWAMHSSSNQRYRADSIRQTYLECITDDDTKSGGQPGNKHVKSIVRQKAYSSPKNPHMFNLQAGFITVGEDGKEIKSHAFRDPITRNRISLHHYVLKSWEDYNDKITRSGKDWRFWNEIEYDIPHVACPEMLKYFPKTANIPKGSKHGKKPEKQSSRQVLVDSSRR